MESTRIKISFKGKNQLPLLMVTKEYYQSKELIFAKVLFQIDGKEMKELKRKL